MVWKLWWLLNIDWSNLFYRYIADKLKKIDGIFIIGKPEVSVVAIGKARNSY